MFCGFELRGDFGNQSLRRAQAIEDGQVYPRPPLENRKFLVRLIPNQQILVS